MNTNRISNGLTALIHDCKVPVVVADTALPDAPLVIINAAFSEMTGYAAEDMIGKNCRFLQPATGAEPAKQRIRAFLADDAQTQNQFVIPNARKDGSRFLNLLLLSKLARAAEPPLVIGSQFDITSRSASELASYNASLKYDMRLIAKLMQGHGWQVPAADDALADSLDRIADLEL